MSPTLAIVVAQGTFIGLALFRFIFYRKLPISELPLKVRLIGFTLAALSFVVLMIFAPDTSPGLLDLKTFWGVVIVFTGLYLYRIVNYPKVRESDLPRTYKRVSATLTTASLVALAVAIYRI